MDESEKSGKHNGTAVRRGRRGSSTSVQIPIHRAKRLDREFLAALEKTLSEWNSDSDEKAYRDL